METKPFRNLPQLPNGTSVADNIKTTDCLPFQHTDINEGVNSFNKITIGQLLCEPVATAGAISGDTYSATCSNFPDFAISYTDEQQNSHYYVGMKVRVVFSNGITYGSVSGGTYPKLNINNSGAIPLLAQGKTMASGACSAGQTLEFTLIPYGNGVAWDADSNVRESTSDYTIYTDGTKVYSSKKIDLLKVVMYGRENSNFLINALMKFGLNTYRETYFKLHIVENGVSLAYIDAIGRFKRDEVCNVQIKNNLNISISATNTVGTIALNGVTNADNLVWTMELLN